MASGIVDWLKNNVGLDLSGNQQAQQQLPPDQPGMTGMDRIAAYAQQQPQQTPAVQAAPQTAAQVPTQPPEDGWGKFKDALGIAERVLSGQTFGAAATDQHLTKQAVALRDAQYQHQMQGNSQLDNLASTEAPDVSYLANSNPATYQKLIEARNDPQVNEDPNGALIRSVNGKADVIYRAPIMKPVVDPMTGRTSFMVFNPDGSFGQQGQAPSAPGMASGLGQRGQTGVSQNVLRTAIAEDAQHPEGPLSVILNRAAATGKTPDEIIAEPHQFEAFNNGAYQNISDGLIKKALLKSPDFASAAAGNIPDAFKQATSFYAPGAQNALGRAAPAWDDGSGFDVGQTRYFNKPYAGKSVPQQAQQAQQPQQPVMQGYNMQQIDPYQGQNASGGAAPVDKMTQSMVDQIGQGKAAPLAISGRSPRNAMIMDQVYQQYPGFDAQTWKMRSDTTKEFFGGTSGTQLGKLNTAIEHMNGLADSIDAVNNSNNPSFINGIGNAIASNIPGQSGAAKKGDLNALDTNLRSTMEEVLGAYKASGGNQSEFEGLMNNLNPNDPKLTQYKVVQKMLELLNGKREQLLQRYQQGMGSNVPLPSALIDPKAVAVADRVARGARGLDTRTPKAQLPGLMSQAAAQPAPQQQAQVRQPTVSNW